MQLPLRREGWVAKSLAESDRLQLLSLLGISAAGILAPVFLKSFLPVDIRTALLGVSTVSSIAATAAAYQNSTDERQEEYQRIARIQQGIHKQRLTHDVNAHTILLEAQAKSRIAATIQKFPAQQRMALAKHYGLMEFVSFPGLQTADPDVGELSAVPATSGQVLNYEYTPPPEPEPAEDWIVDLVAKFVEPDQSKRMYAHLIVNGPTKSGKSTLTSKLLELIAQGVSAHGNVAEMMLIDPKYPKTEWPLNPSFRGFDMVLIGLEKALEEFRRRKKLCVKAEESGRPHPDFSHLICVVDEQDSIYNEGKGHPELGSDKESRKNAAQDIHSMEVNLLKESAAYNISLFVVGQSPLSGATGFSRSDMQQACRIVLGNEALKWLNDKEFPFKEDVPELQSQLKYWMDKNSRVALICPNIGRAYVEAIPHLQVSKINVIPRSSTAESLQDPWQDSEEPKPKSKATSGKQNLPFDDVIALLKEWIAELGRNPSDDELASKLAEIEPSLKGRLNDSGLAYLKSKLGLT